jgi:acyl-CoA synthetase (AMP-forming)/AMP-acid ligase II
MQGFTAPVPTVGDLIAHNGRWHADKLALIDSDVRLSWREVAESTARVANGLLALGVRRGERVAVLMDNRHEAVLAMFGIVRAGAVAVPLNAFITDHAVANMCADADCVAIFASGWHCQRIEALRQSSQITVGHLIGCEAPQGRWHEFSDFLAAHSFADPRIAMGAEEECNIIYSSGTTALPKGIVHTHGCRMAWAYDCGIALRYRSGCRTLCTLGPYSNISWVSMLATILVGGTIVLLRQFTAEGMLALVEAEHITHGAFVPLQLERVLAYPGRERFRTGSLDVLMCCGSPLSPAVKQQFVQTFACHLIELYGLTEGVFTILAPEDFDRKIQSVGKPVLGTDIRIVDDAGREVPTGETGEIVGYSRVVMAGYHGRDASNLEATWIDETGRQWLRTGDLGRLDEEGFLYLVDRKKDLILSGGQNVYPADIEVLLREHPAVAEVAVIGVSSDRWGETPVAIVVVLSASQVTEAGLVEWINARVGRQQRVSAVVFRDSLPRNANGKVLKRELRLEYTAIAGGQRA